MCNRVDDDVAGAGLFFCMNGTIETIAAQPIGKMCPSLGLEHLPTGFAKSHTGFNGDRKWAERSLYLWVRAHVFLHGNQCCQTAPGFHLGVFRVFGKNGVEGIPCIPNDKPTLLIYSIDQWLKDDAHQVCQRFSSPLTVGGKCIGHFGKAGEIHKNGGA